MGRIDIMAALGRAWELFARDPLRLIGLVLLASIVSVTIILAPLMMARGFVVLGRIARRETAAVGDLFQPFGEFERYLLGGLIWLGAQLVGVVIGSWLPFLGTALALAVNAFLLPFLPLMVHQGLDGPAAFSACRALFSREWPMLLVTAGILTVLGWVGTLPLMLGLIVTIPYSLALIHAVYEQLYGADDSGVVQEGAAASPAPGAGDPPPDDSTPAA